MDCPETASLLFDPHQMDATSVYRLMISAIVPRPIAWVGSTDGSGDAAGDNLSPFSYFMGVGSDPPLLAISVARASRRGGQDPGGAPLKHTARNILATGAFSVSIVTEADLETMHATSAAWPGPEFDAVGVPRACGVRIAAPHPAGAAFTFECLLHETVDLGSTHLFVGRVVLMLGRPDVMAAGAVDVDRLAPVARLGGDGYTGLGSVRHLPRARVPG